MGHQAWKRQKKFDSTIQVIQFAWRGTELSHYSQIFIPSPQFYSHLNLARQKKLKTLSRFAKFDCMYVQMKSKHLKETISSKWKLIDTCLHVVIQLYQCIVKPASEAS